MLYALLYYGSEDAIGELRPLIGLSARHGSGSNSVELTSAIKLDVQLLPTTTAVTVRGGVRPVVMDGPYDFAKDELLSFKVIKASNLDKALAFVESSLRGAEGPIACEIRPIARLENPYEAAILINSN
jgi:hypothetical protein